jgi:PKD repeat protein
VTFSPDGNYILSASSDKTLKLWRNNLAASPIEIKLNPAEGIAPLNVELTASSTDIGSITTYKWFLNNQKIADGNPANYVFKTGGKHLIKLIATDTEGLEYESTASVKVKSPPIAKASANPSTGKATLKVKFDASQSIDYDGKIIKYEWLLNNGKTIIGKEANHSFDTIREYKITLTVTDNDGLTASEDITVTVTENFTLTVKKNAGGIVEAEGINCGNDCSQDYVSNTEVILIAVPKDGFRFKEWKGESCSGSENSCKFKMDSNKEVTAIFEKKPEGVQGQAIIIAGGGAKPENTLFPYTHEFTERMYQILNERGFTDTDIQYLSPLAPDIDMDGYPDKERHDYELFEPKKDITEAFTKAAAKLTEGQQFIFYIHSHANPNNLTIDDKTKLSVLELKQLLAKIPTNVQQIVFIDSCYSGSFFDELTGVKGRILISSANDKSLAWHTEYASFSDRFLRAIRRGENLFGAFKFSEDMIKRNQDIFSKQEPWLDDDADGIYTSRDKAIAKATYFGKQGIHAAEAPTITQVHPRISLEENNTKAILWVKIREKAEDIYKVRAILRNPNQENLDYDGLNTNFSREEIELFYNPAQQRYEYDYKNFSIKGTWKIIYQAQSKQNVWSEIVFGEVQAEGRNLPVTVKMLLNQSSYTSKDPVRVDMRVDGKSLVDLYVALIFPDQNFITITYPLKWSLPKSIQAYKNNLEITKQTTFPIMRTTMPKGIPKGDYSFCGVLVKPGMDANKQENWIDLDCEGFKLN